MSRISRRNFLQFAGSTLATLGLSHLDIIQRGNRYAQVLTQNTSRKLALLVGVNNYPTNSRFFGDLEGCVTDVDLHQELLIHRFGFNPSDIIRLTSDEPANKQPTRSNILTLVALAAELNRSSGPIKLKEPVEVIGDLLDDLSGDVSRQAASHLRGIVEQAREVSASEVATLSITFEVG